MLELNQTVFLILNNKVTTGVIDGVRYIKNRIPVTSKEFECTPMHNRKGLLSLGPDTERYSVQLDESVFVNRNREDLFLSREEIYNHLFGDI